MTQLQEIVSEQIKPITPVQAPIEPNLLSIFKEIGKLSQIYQGLKPGSPMSQSCVTKSGFIQYFNLPRIVGIRLFHAVLDKKSWNCADFVAFSQIFHKGQAAQQTALVFAMLDFNGDGYVTRQDCHLLLSHTLGLPSKRTFEQILVTQSDIGEILDRLFKKAGQKLSFFQYRMLQQSTSNQVQDGIFKFLRSRVNFYQQSLQEHKVAVSEDMLPDYSPISNGGEILQWPLAKQKAREVDVKMEAEHDEGVLMEGPMYRLYSDIGLKAYHYKLKNRTLFVYRREEETEAKYTIELNPNFVLCTRKTNIQSIEGQKFLQFSLIEGAKIRDFYHLKEQLYVAWKEAIESVITVPKAVEQDYILGQVLKNGKKSKVQRATHRVTQKVVVVKTMKKHGLKQDEYEAIRNEIQISKMCKHPHLLELLDVYEDQLNVYLVLENMQGGNLFSFATKMGAMNPAIVRGLVLQIAAAVYYLRNFNIVHRDLKPDNILLTGKVLKFKDLTGKEEVNVPQVKVADFGLSVALNINEKLNQPFGTMNFAAPQILRDSPYDEKIDMYSLGVTIYMLLCGHLPFQTTEVEMLLDEIIYEAPSFSSSAFSKTPSELITLTKKLLLKDPRRRIGIEELLTNKFLFKHDKEQRKERKSCKASQKFEVFTSY